MGPQRRRKKQQRNPGNPQELLALAVSAADLKERRRAVRMLARAIPDGPGRVALFDRLRAHDVKLALHYVTRVHDPIPNSLLKSLLADVSTKTFPLRLRLAAAGKLLAAIPDEARQVEVVVRAITDEKSPRKTLERLIRLQSMVKKCDALDTLVRARESSTRMQCRTCGALMTRPVLIAHLWKKHRLLFKRGEAVEPRALLDRAVTRAAIIRNPAAIDHTYLLSKYYYPEVELRDVFQALAARGAGADDPEQFDRLLNNAAQGDCGLCPFCLAQVPDPVQPLPPPASLSEGRVSADGYEVEVIDGPAGRRVSVIRPGEQEEIGPDRKRNTPPRLAAVLFALPFFVIALAAGLFVPMRLIHPELSAGGGVLLAWVVYGAVLTIRKPLPDRSARAIAIAWEKIVPGIGRTAPAIRFLIRLCRASFDLGNPADRSKKLFELVEHAGVLTERYAAYAQLFAAARVLQAHDAARLGRDKITGLISVFEPFFKGEVPPGYVETAAEIIVNDGILVTGDAERLGVMLINAAYDRSWSPADVTAVVRFCPWFRNLLASARPEYLAMTYNIWRERNTRPWERVGPSKALLNLVQDAPAEARRILAQSPDAILRLEIDKVLGPVFLTSQGVMIGGQTLGDPKTKIDVFRSAKGTWMLNFGPHLFTLRDKPGGNMKTLLRAWLNHYATVMIPACERLERRKHDPRVHKILSPLAVPCPLCATVCVQRSGQLGTPWVAFGSI